MIWFGFYVTGCAASFVYSYKTITQMNARYSLGAEHSGFYAEDWVALTLLPLASWASFVGALGFRLSAGYGFWGRSDDA